jgi:hypothetical protein
MELLLREGAAVLDPLTSFLITAGVPQPPGSNPDPQAQFVELLDSLGRLRASWAEIRRHLEDEGYEAGEFALFCRVHLNLLDNCAAILEALDGLSDRLPLPMENLRSAAVEIQSQQDEIRPLYELATRKPAPLDPGKLLAAQSKHAGEPAVEVGELLRRVQAGEIEL